MVIQIVITPLPTYLKELLPKYAQKNINYIYNSILKKANLYNSPENEDSVNEEELELTGQPLETKLDDSAANSSFLTEKCQNWSTEEECYYPLKLKDARKLMNAEIRKNNVDSNDTTTYVFCDGNDDKHMLLIGASVSKNIERIFVYALPNYRTSDELFLENKLKVETGLKQNNFSKTAYSIKKSYLIFGPPLVNNALENTEDFKGSIYIEASCDDLEDREIFLKHTNLEMTLKSKVGHKNSSLQLFWDDFCLLHEYYQILTSENLHEDTGLLEQGMEINEIISTFEKNINEHNFEKKTYGTLSLQNLRSLSVPDKIWNALKQCKDLKSLHECFEIILDQLSACSSQRFIADDDDCAKIINDLLQRKWILCSFHQSLQLLIEFGLAKLKQDYITIFDYFSGINQRFISQNWSKFVYEPESRRLTVRSKAPSKNEIINNMKFSFLYQMHTSAELLLLSHEELPTLSQETFNNFIASINHILTKSTKFDDINFYTHIIKCSFNMSPSDSTLIEKLYPAKAKIQIKTISRLEEVLTVYCYTKFPIIPNVNYDLGETGEGEEIYYVTKLMKFTDPL